MSVDFLSVLPGLDCGTLQRLQELALAGGQLELRRGDVLIRQGEPSDMLYFVLSGRFAVHPDGTTEPLTEIGQGQPIGEIGFFGELPRTATVVAMRDSSVLCLTRDEFQQISDSSPGMRDALIISLSRRLSEKRSTAEGPSIPRTVAVIWAGGSRPSHGFADSLREVSSSIGRSMFLTRAEMMSRCSGIPLDDTTISSWLNSLESDFDFLFYIADDTLSDWTQKCIRQADAVLLVAVNGSCPEPNPSELFSFSVLPPSARRLVLLHQARSNVVSGTSSWLGQRDVFMHHHVCLQDHADMKRLVRFLYGQAIGFVAAGGGALGSAHVGVYKALSEAGAEFDILGGTSVGAAMMAAFACGADPERVDQGTWKVFVKSRAFRRPTLPRYGLINHKIFDRALRTEYGDVRIEDLWRPFFAVSTNLCTQAPKIHRQGPVWHAVRASGSIPGVLPPFFTKEGEMLVDGALSDNVPLAPMKVLKTGPNVIVLLSVEGPAAYPVDYDSIPGPRELAAAIFNPFLRQRLPRVPSILQIIMLSMMASSRRNLQLSETDVVIRPELPNDLRFSSWDRHTEIFLHAYRAVGPWIQSRLAEGDPGLLSVIRARA